jgi:hypothetical protein
MLPAKRPIGLLFITALFLTACAGGSVQNERADALLAWENLVRWSEYDALIDFLHPDYLAAYPVTALDIERLHQFRVTEYRVRQVVAEPDGLALERRVRIRLYHVHSARERVVDHREVWRYDGELKGWLLHSGLPDPRLH